MTAAHPRHRRLDDALAAHDLDAVLLASPGNVCYATGAEVFLPVDSGTEFAGGPTLALAVCGGDVALIVPDAHATRAADQVDIAGLRPFPSFGHFEPVDERAAFLDAVRDALAGVGNGRLRLGVETRWLPASVLQLLLSECAGVEIADAVPALLDARRVKTAGEIERLRAAVRAADAGQERLRETARPGSLETTLWGEVVGAASASAGHEVPAVGEIVTGPRTGVLRYPGGPVDRAVEAGDTVLMDLSVRVDGYWADCTNTFVSGAEPTAEQLRFYRASREAIDAAIGELRPGRCAADVARAARAAFAAHGLEPAHYTGHQVGVTVNEPPRLVEYDETPIEPGMVFAVEPGAYGGESAGTGARSEKVVLVTEDGPEVLSAFGWGME